jgi:hypothetical protein
MAAPVGLVNIDQVSAAPVRHDGRNHLLRKVATPSRQTLMLDRPFSGSVCRFCANRPPGPGTFLSWRVAAHPGRQVSHTEESADKGFIPADGDDRWGQVTTCRHSRGDVRSHDFQDKTTYNEPRELAR